MNILPHKSWHVRTKKSIARFKRDEEKARAEEETKAKAIKLAESEARICQLRQHKVARTTTKVTATGSADDGEAFNLFANFEDNIGDDVEQKKEKATEQEKWEVKAGIFSYLDGRYRHDAGEGQWYLKSHEERMKLDKDVVTPQSIKDEKIKASNDPLNVIKFYQKKLTKTQDAPNIAPTIKQEHDDDDDDSMTKERLGKLYETAKAKKLKKSKKKSKKSKKSKKHKKHRSRSDSEDSDDDDDDDDDGQAETIKAKLIDKLRQERLRREQAERVKTKRLLQGDDDVEPPETSNQAFNSQFNPHLAKQNKNR